MTTSPVTITLDTDTIKKIDEVRGLTKRSTLIESILSDFLINSERKTSQSRHPRDQSRSSE